MLTIVSVILLLVTICSLPASKRVVITQRGDDVLVDVYILVSYGTKISVICQNIQQAVKYSVEQLLGFEVSYVNVHVQGVKID